MQEILKHLELVTFIYANISNSLQLLRTFTNNRNNSFKANKFTPVCNWPVFHIMLYSANNLQNALKYKYLQNN